ncbi:MAG: YhcB family protein [Oleiphilaceae bacterium]|nr:YhcB family protein [Oleiphilaceae bacterium]
MDSTLVIGIAALAAGIVIGWLISRLGGSKVTRQRRLAQQLDQIQTEHTRYQAEVNQHFMETADLIRRLNDSYRDVHDHLAKGASKLCSEGDIRHELEQARSGSRLTHNPVHASPEPPRDYAPKSGHQDKGTLSEDYGLDKEPVQEPRSTTAQS